MDTLIKLIQKIPYNFTIATNGSSSFCSMVTLTLTILLVPGDARLFSLIGSSRAIDRPVPGFACLCSVKEKKGFHFYFLWTGPGVNINSCHFLPPSGGLLSRCLLEIPRPCLVLCLLHRIIYFFANPTSSTQVGRYSMNPLSRSAWSANRPITMSTTSDRHKPSFFMYIPCHKLNELMICFWTGGDESLFNSAHVG